jgi:hypothetical protein
MKKIITLVFILLLVILSVYYKQKTINIIEPIIEEEIESTKEILRRLFIDKYPKYTDTISVNIEKETSNHAR